MVLLNGGNDDVVTWCVGHLLEQAEPDAYDPKFKQWRLEHLPIIPEKWILLPRKRSQKTTFCGGKTDSSSRCFS